MNDKRLRNGAILFALGSAQFLVAMVLAQMAYPCYNGVCYNILTNPISDLGNTATSPLWPLFNYSLVVFGLFFFVGIFLIIDAFPKGAINELGFISLAISAMGAIGVGVVPENTILAIHSLAALVAFGLSGLGLLLIGIAKYRKLAGKGLPYTVYTALSGIIPLAVLLLYLLPSGGIHSTLALSGPGWGFGGVERVIALPPLVWVLVTGLYLLKRKMA